MDAGTMRRHDPRLLLLAIYSTVIGMVTEVEVLRALGEEPTARSLVRRRADVLQLLRSALLVEPVSPVDRSDAAAELRRRRVYCSVGFGIFFLRRGLGRVALAGGRWLASRRRGRSWTASSPSRVRSSAPRPGRGLPGDQLRVGGAVAVDPPGPQHEPAAEQDEDEPDEAEEQGEAEADQEEVERRPACAVASTGRGNRGRRGAGGRPPSSQASGATAMVFLPALGDLVLGDDVGAGWRCRRSWPGSTPRAPASTPAGRGRSWPPCAARGHDLGRSRGGRTHWGRAAVREGAHDAGGPGLRPSVAVVGGGRHDKLRVPVAPGHPKSPRPDRRSAPTRATVVARRIPIRALSSAG